MLILQSQETNQTQKPKGKIYIYLRQVTFNDAKKFCDENKLQYVETSATDGKNIKVLFETITSSLYENLNYVTNKDKTIVIDQAYKNTEEVKKKKCCQK